MQLYDATCWRNSLGGEVACDGSMAIWRLEPRQGLVFVVRDGKSYFYMLLECVDLSSFSAFELDITAPITAECKFDVQEGHIKDGRNTRGKSFWSSISFQPGRQTVRIPFANCGAFNTRCVWAIVLASFDQACVRQPFILHGISLARSTQPPPVVPVQHCFTTLDGWVDGSQSGGGPDNYSLDGRGALVFSVHPNSRARAKVRHSGYYAGPGRHQWRVYTPLYRPGDISSIGAFLYADDTHELDFEIGYGSITSRGKAGAKEQQLVAHLTSQSTDGASPRTLDQSLVAVDADAWHALAIDVDLDLTGTRFLVHWWIDGVCFKSSMQNWGPAHIGAGFRVLVSLENLPWMGAEHAMPPVAVSEAEVNVARVSHYAFTPCARQCSELGSPKPPQ